MLQKNDWIMKDLKDLKAKSWVLKKAVDNLGSDWDFYT